MSHHHPHRGVDAASRVPKFPFPEYESPLRRFMLKAATNLRVAKGTHVEGRRPRIILVRSLGEKDGTDSESRFARDRRDQNRSPLRSVADTLILLSTVAASLLNPLSQALEAEFGWTSSIRKVSEVLKYTLRKGWSCAIQ